MIKLSIHFPFFLTKITHTTKNSNLFGVVFRVYFLPQGVQKFVVLFFLNGSFASQGLNEGSILCRRTNRLFIVKQKPIYEVLEKPSNDRTNRIRTCHFFFTHFFF